MGGVLKKVKQFSKDIGEPEEIICDAAGEQASIVLPKLWIDIVTTLRVL